MRSAALIMAGLCVLLGTFCAGKLADALRSNWQGLPSRGGPTDLLHAQLQRADMLLAHLRRVHDRMVCQEAEWMAYLRQYQHHSPRDRSEQSPEPLSFTRRCEVGQENADIPSPRKSQLMDLAGQASVYQRSQSQAGERERWLEEMRRQLEELKSRRQQFGLELAQLTARLEKLKLCLGYWQREPASAVQDFLDDEGLALAELRRLLENLERHVAVEQALQRLRLRQTPAGIPIPIGDGTSSPPPER